MSFSQHPMISSSFFSQDDSSHLEKDHVSKAVCCNKFPSVEHSLCGFLTLCLCLGMSTTGSGMFNFGINFSAKKECQSCHIKPNQQNDYRAQRSVGFAVGIKKMQIHAKPKRGQ